MGNSGNSCLTTSPGRPWGGVLSRQLGLLSRGKALPNHSAKAARLGSLPLTLYKASPGDWLCLTGPSLQMSMSA